MLAVKGCAYVVLCSFATIVIGGPGDFAQDLGHAVGNALTGNIAAEGGTAVDTITNNLGGGVTSKEGKVVQVFTTEGAVKVQEGNRSSTNIASITKTTAQKDISNTVQIGGTVTANSGDDGCINIGTIGTACNDNR